MGCDDWEQEKYGTGLAYFQSAMDSYNDAVKLLKNLKGDTKSKADEALVYSSDVFAGRLVFAEKKNVHVFANTLT